MLTRPAGPWVMWPGAAGPCYSGSRCFMGISVGLALVEGLPAAGWARSVSVCSVRGTRGRGKRLGRRPDGRRAARRPCHPQKPFVERLLEPGLAAPIPACGNWKRGRFRCIVIVRGGDGGAALATGHVAPDNRRQESPTAAAVGLPPSCSPRRRSGTVDGNRATAAPARDSTNPASIHRLRFVMDEGPPVPPVPARWPGGPCDGCEDPVSGFRGSRRSPVFLPVCQHRGMSGLRPWRP